MSFLFPRGEDDRSGYRYREVQEGRPAFVFAPHLGSVNPPYELPGAGRRRNLFTGLWELAKSSWLNVLLIFLPLALGFQYGKLSGGEYTFLASWLTLLPLSNLMAILASEMAQSLTSSMSISILHCITGNLVPTIFALVAISRDMLPEAKFILLGCIVANTFLVLGSAITMGAVKNVRLRLEPAGAGISPSAPGSLHLLAILALLLPAAIAWSGGAVLHASRGAAVILLFAYLLNFFLQLNAYRDMLAEQVVAANPSLPSWLSFLLFAVFTGLHIWISNTLLAHVHDAAYSWGTSVTAISFILIPVAAQISNLLTASTLAKNEKIGSSLTLALASSMQIALAVIPFAIIVSWILTRPLHLYLPLSQIITMLFAVLTAQSISAEGEVHLVHGLFLLASYAIIAMTFWML